MPPKKAASAAKSPTKSVKKSVKKAPVSKSAKPGEKSAPPKVFKSLNEVTEVTNVYAIVLCGKPANMALERVGDFLNIPGGYKDRSGGEKDLDAITRIYKLKTGEALPKVTKTIHFRSTMLFVLRADKCPKQLELVPFTEVEKQVTNPSANGPKLREILIANLAYNMKELKALL